MAELEGRIEIPIEISPTDTREINQLLERIERAESKLAKLSQDADTILPEGGGGPVDLMSSTSSEESHTNPRKRRKKQELPELPEVEEEEIGGGIMGEIETAGFLLLSGGAPIQREYPESPLLGGLTGNIPNVRGRDTSSRSPIQRENQFKKLKDEVDEVKKKLSPLQEFEESAGTAVSIFRNPTGFITGIISKAAPIIGPILIAKGLMDLIIEELIRPGGPYDRRFKILIEKQVNKLTDRTRLAQIRAGLAEIRVSSSLTLRGSRGMVATNLSFYKSGNPLYSETLENYAKGGMQ